MYRFNYLLLIIVPFIVSCNNNNSKSIKATTATTKTDTIRLDTTTVKPRYKRYTGTVNGQEVVVNLYQTARNEFRGTYCYNKKGILLELNSMNDSCSGCNLFLFETARTERSDDNDFHNNPHWAITISADKLQGKWVSKDGTKSYPIELKEDYSGDAVAFDVKIAGDTQKIKHGPTEVSNTLTYMWAEPSAQTNKSDAAWLLSVLKQKMGAKDISASINDLVVGNIKESFRNFKAGIDTEGDISEEEALTYSQESAERYWVNYNQNGFLVFESYNYIYTGGAHGIYGSTFICADMQTKRVWELKDIMHIDTLKLQALITGEARRKFHIPEDSALSNALLTDTISLTDNCYFTHTGVVFNYTPYQIASFADGEVQFFIPFTQLMDMLTPEFKQRMKL